MNYTNTITSRTNLDGSIDYIVDLGSIIYNDQIIDLRNLRIPLFEQAFFTPIIDREKYAVVNVYYRVETGSFLFDLIQKSSSVLSFMSAPSIDNVLPIGQFVLRQHLNSFYAADIREYSLMATYAVTDTNNQGVTGFVWDNGATGIPGYTGPIGNIGDTGLQGFTGFQGITGVGDQGDTGLRGPTGYAPDTRLVFYEKFKYDDDTLEDSSIYCKDFMWTACQAGYTGYFLTGAVSAVTGMEYVFYTGTGYVVEDGIVDKCHSVTYRGNTGLYKMPEYIDLPGFTGILQAWVRADVVPIPDFTYVVDGTNPLKVTFTDASIFLPSSWTWYFETEHMSGKRAVHIFSALGEHLVKLRVCNAHGCSEKIKVITL